VGVDEMGRMSNQWFKERLGERGEGFVKIK
jgi:hypothetical protein